MRLSSAINNVNLIGEIKGDIEKSQTNLGVPSCNFIVETVNEHVSATGEEFYNTDAHYCFCTADLAGKVLKKFNPGDLVAVTGFLRYFKRRDGGRNAKILCMNVEYL